LFCLQSHLQGRRYENLRRRTRASRKKLGEGGPKGGNAGEGDLRRDIRSFSYGPSRIAKGKRRRREPSYQRTAAKQNMMQFQQRKGMQAQIGKGEEVTLKKSRNIPTTNAQKGSPTDTDNVSKAEGARRLRRLNKRRLGWIKTRKGEEA